MRKISLTLLLIILISGFASWNHAFASQASDETGPSLGPNVVFLPTIQSRTGPSIFGLEMGVMVEGTDLDAVTKAGTSWVRRNALNWDQVEPVKGQLDWSKVGNLENELILAQKNNLKVILIVRGSPVWARKVADSTCGPVASQALPAFASFVHEAVIRYSQPPYSIKYWEIQNEPDVAVDKFDAFGCWGDANDPYYGGGYFGEMLKQVYPKIKSADPQAEVIVGGLLMDCDPLDPPIENGKTKNCTPSKFLEGIIKNGAGNYFDGVAFHSYDYYKGKTAQYYNPNWHSEWNTTGPAADAKFSYLKNVLASYNLSDKFLMATEAALLCNTTCDGNFETTKAIHLVRTYLQAMKNGLIANIWYDWEGYWRNSGLRFPDGSLRPAFIAYKFLNKEVGKTPINMEINKDGASGYEFRPAKGVLWVIYSADGSTHTLLLPSTPSAVYDVLGNSLTPGASIQVTSSPVYIEWNK